MKKLLATTAVLTALVAPATASVSDVDNGVAAIMVYGGLCDPRDIPESVIRTLTIYMKARRAEVLVEMKSVMDKIYSVGAKSYLDRKAAENQWCSWVRPRLLEHFSRWDMPVPDAPTPDDPVPAPAPKQAKNAAELKWTGVVNLRQSTIGCYDIQDTLNPGKARRLADRANRYLANYLTSSFTNEEFAENTKCEDFNNREPFAAWNVIGQSLPELPSDKVATCLTAAYSSTLGKSTSEGYPRCWWVITNKTDLSWEVRK